MSRSSLQKLTPSVCRKEAVLTDVTSQGLSYKNAPLDFTHRKVNLWPLTWFPGPQGNLRGRDYIQWRLRQMAQSNGRFLCAHCPAQTRFNLNNKSLQVSPTRFAYNSPWSSCNVPLWENVTAHPVHYSPTLVRRRIKCHFDSFPIWSKFLVDKMQMSAIIWQVIWWCRRYGGYA